MKTNIVLFCVLNNYSKIVGELLAEKLKMCFVDADSLLKSDKPGVKAAKSAKENKVIKKISDYENSIIISKADTLFVNKNFEALSKNSLIVYLQISPKFFEARAKYSGDFVEPKIDLLQFSEKDKQFVEECDLVLNCSAFKEEKCVKKLSKLVKKHFKKQKNTQ